MIKTIKPHHNKHTYTYNERKYRITIQEHNAALYGATFSSILSLNKIACSTCSVVVLRFVGLVFLGRWPRSCTHIYVLYKILLYKLLYDVVVPVFIYMTTRHLCRMMFYYTGARRRTLYTLMFSYKHTDDRFTKIWTAIKNVVHGEQGCLFCVWVGWQKRKISYRSGLLFSCTRTAWRT